MAFDFIAWHGRDLNNHKSETDKAAAAGYRTSSLCIYGDANNPLFAAVMVKRPAVHTDRQFFTMNKTQFSETIDSMWKQGLGAYLVTATGTVDNPVFAASFRPMSEKPIVRYGILGTGDQLLNLHYDFWRDGYYPVWMDAYGIPANTQIVTVWHRNTARLAWNIEAASRLSDLPTRQAIFNAITAQGARPTVVAMAPGSRFFGLFVDNVVGSWASRTNLTGDGYQQEFNQQVAAGRCPICVTAEGSGSNVRYSAIFADREQPIERVPTVTTTIQGSPTVKGIDDAVLKFMKDHAMRGCSLAITKGTRLVYARGYTLAEPGYPIHKETTLFRQASVSKLFVAAAIYRLIQLGTKLPNGSSFSLDTTMQAVLNLKTPDGKAPADDRFKDITIRHLLESISSINQGWLWWHQEAAAAFKSPLPGKPAQLASFIAAQKLGKKDPGDTTNVNYGNVDYFMLSQVVAALANTNTFEDALTKLVLTPLQITRVRGSRSLQTAQALDEARYHVVNLDPTPKADQPGKYNDYPPSLWFTKSSMSDDHPLVPQQYGGDNYEVFDGCGGLSAAVTDIARLLSALGVRNPNAVFSETTLKQWFEQTIKATQTNTNPDPDAQVHGYHGFDWGSQVDGSQPILAAGNFRGAKGGWLPSHSTSFEFGSGDFGYVIACNSVGQSDVKTDWLRNIDGQGNWWEVDPASVMGVAQAHDWGTTDLFNNYQMAPFVTGQNGSIGKASQIKLPKMVQQVGGTHKLEQDTMITMMQQAASARMTSKRSQPA
ncbi:serine hydrolase [Spirosoma pulveris]